MRYKMKLFPIFCSDACKNRFVIFARREFRESGGLYLYAI